MIAGWRRYRILSGQRGHNFVLIGVAELRETSRIGYSHFSSAYPRPDPARSRTRAPGVIKTNCYRRPAFIQSAGRARANQHLQLPVYQDRFENDVRALSSSHDELLTPSLTSTLTGSVIYGHSFQAIFHQVDEAHFLRMAQDFYAVTGECIPR